MGGYKTPRKPGRPALPPEEKLVVVPVRRAVVPKAIRRPAVQKASKVTPSTARVQALRERRAGLKRVEVYAHTDDAEAIKRYAAMLARRRAKAGP